MKTKVQKFEVVRYYYGEVKLIATYYGYEAANQHADARNAHPSVRNSGAYYSIRMG